MTELNSEILASWILSGYKHIICTIVEGRINLHPIIKEVDIQFENFFLLPINDKLISEVAEGRAILGYKFVCDTLVN